MLFDPVYGAGDFLNGAPGDRLINVAISRAMQHVFIFLSQGDFTNPTLRRIARLCETPEGVPEPAEDDATSSRDQPRLHTVADFSSRPDFPVCLENQVLKAGSFQGRVIAVRGRKLVILDEEQGERTLLLDYLLRKGSEPT